MFERDSGAQGRRQIYQFVPGSTGPTLLIADGGQPDFSPDGTKLAYTVRDASEATSQIWIADADGNNPKQLTNEPVTEPDRGAFGAAWSPDGSSILFSQATAGEPPLKKINVASGEVTPLVVNGGGASWQPVVRNAVERVWGAGHIETAVAASQYNYESKAAPDFRAPANAVVLSRDDTYFDALVGSAFAINQQAPLLVTNRSTLDSRVEREIQRVLGSSGTVYLLGGELALAPAVANRLSALGFTVTRIWGQTHFDTALEINRRITNDPDIAIVTTGTNFFDALAAGTAAGANPGTVIVLTNGDQMPATSASYLNALNPDPETGGTLMVTAGGPGDRALGAAFTGGQLPNWPDDAGRVRLVGANERESALMIADFFFAAPPVVAVATNRTWFDALTGGAMVGFNGGPLLITDPTALYPGVRDYLSRNSGNVWSGVLMGGPAALPEALQAPVGDAISLPGEWDYVSITPQQAASTSAVAAQHRGAGDSGHRPVGSVPGAGTAPTPLTR